MTQSISVDGSNAAASAAGRKHGPAHESLERLIGRWNLHGQQFESPFGRAAPISGVETFEWLPGNLFVIHRLDGQLGDQPMACIEIIEHDPSAGIYRLHTFYNDGRSNDWEGRFIGDAWIVSGSWKYDAQSQKVRCRTTFDASGKQRTSRWERSNGDSEWQTFWDVQATKSG
jgi:hypothetical protein